MLRFILLTAIVVSSCNSEDRAAGTDGWLKGDADQKFETVSKHLRGFDMVMVETGYRFAELYWAGRDQNWEYANYQVDKIKTTIENGIERRPKRAATAQAFLQHSIPAMKEGIQKKDTAVFNQSFVIFQTACKSCHIAEKVPFIESVIPQQRLSAVKFTRE